MRGQTQDTSVVADVGLFFSHVQDSSSRPKDEEPRPETQEWSDCQGLGYGANTAREALQAADSSEERTNLKELSSRSFLEERNQMTSADGAVIASDSSPWQLIFGQGGGDRGGEGLVAQRSSSEFGAGNSHSSFITPEVTPRCHEANRTRNVHGDPEEQQLGAGLVQKEVEVRVWPHERVSKDEHGRDIVVSANGASGAHERLGGTGDQNDLLLQSLKEIESWSRQV